MTVNKELLLSFDKTEVFLEGVKQNLCLRISFSYLQSVDSSCSWCYRPIFFHIPNRLKLHLFVMNLLVEGLQFYQKWMPSHAFT